MLIITDFGEKTLEANSSIITPKGLDIPAQGSALGWYVAPFQGLKNLLPKIRYNEKTWTFPFHIPQTVISRP